MGSYKKRGSELVALCFLDARGQNAGELALALLLCHVSSLNFLFLLAQLFFVRIKFHCEPGIQLLNLVCFFLLQVGFSLFFELDQEFAIYSQQFGCRVGINISCRTSKIIIAKSIHRHDAQNCTKAAYSCLFFVEYSVPSPQRAQQYWWGLFVQLHWGGEEEMRRKRARTKAVCIKLFFCLNTLFFVYLLCDLLNFLCVLLLKQMDLVVHLVFEFLFFLDHQRIHELFQQHHLLRVIRARGYCFPLSLSFCRIIIWRGKLAGGMKQADA